MGGAIGFILLIFSFVLLAAINKSHKEETGVSMPSRNAMRRIRRSARKKGISEGDAYNKWLSNKQRRSPVVNADFQYTPDTRPPKLKAEPTLFLPRNESERLTKLIEDRARELASQRQLKVNQRDDGTYYFINLRRDGPTMPTNPFAAGVSYEFTLEQLVEYLTYDASGPPPAAGA